MKRAAQVPFVVSELEPFMRAEKISCPLCEAKPDQPCNVGDDCAIELGPGLPRGSQHCCGAKPCEQILMGYVHWERLDADAGA